MSAPAELGSAGGNAGGSGGDTTVSGGSGGGAVILEAGGALTVNGTISANGWPGSSTYAGGGSGGSVWLTAATIAGTGTNEANGASRSAAVGGTLGGGGGGRIAFTTPDNQFAGTVRATGAWGRYHRAGHGTFNFQDVYGPADAVTITGNIALSPSNDWAFGSLTVAGGATLDIQSRTDLVSRVAVAGGVLVNEGAGIAADGLGFWYTQGPGAGSGRNGASHGGQGGNAPATGFSGPTYDAVNAPCELGSGGGNGSGAFHGGLGGGAVILTAGGTATISGTLSANGWHDAGSYSAGGSGGSVWIAAAAIEGAGLVQANGAPSGYGGGGGGRIAFTTPDNRFAGTVQAAGGSGGACDKAGNGTFNFGEFYGPSDDLVVAADIALPPSSNWSFASLTVVTSAALGGVVFEIQSATDLVSRVTVAGDVRVGSNAVLSASGLGFPWQQGPGAGVNRSGASHGGKGGDGVSGLGVAPPPYGASNAPSALGSGGGTGNSGTVGDPRGGGALILAIGGALTVDGVLAADGWRSGGGYGGGGSGGSIWALAKIVRGSGVLRADGGLGTVNGGGGGGGRVAVWNGGPFSAGVIACILAGETVPGMIVTNALPASFTGSLWARGGAGGNVGEDGTVVCISVPAPRGAIFGVR